MSKPTLILGACPNPERYSYIATLRLHEAGHEVYTIGIKEGNIGKKKLLTIEILRNRLILYRYMSVRKNKKIGMT